MVDARRLFDVSRRGADTHIARKFDMGVAEAVRREAVDWRDAFAAARDPEEIADGLLGWDAALKSRGINPGNERGSHRGDVICVESLRHPRRQMRSRHLALAR